MKTKTQPILMREGISTISFYVRVVLPTIPAARGYMLRHINICEVTAKLKNGPLSASTTGASQGGVSKSEVVDLGPSLKDAVRKTKKRAAKKASK